MVLVRRSWRDFKKTLRKVTKSESESESGEMTRSTLNESDSVCETSELNRLETERHRIRVFTSETELNMSNIRASGS